LQSLGEIAPMTLIQAGVYSPHNRRLAEFHAANQLAACNMNLKDHCYLMMFFAWTTTCRPWLPSIRRQWTCSRPWRTT
jgi:hypothetical protein